MMVPRAFVYASNPAPRSKKLDEKEERRARLRRASANWNVEDTTTSPSKTSQSGRAPSPSPPLPSSDPVGIPLRRAPRSIAKTTRPKPQRQIASSPALPASAKGVESKQRAVPSVEEVLTSTAIPRRRTAGGRKSQRLPPVNHVEEFSRLLQDDLTLRNDGILSTSIKNSPSLDILISPPNELNEDDMFVDSHATSFPRSISLESMPSLDRDDDSSVSISISAPDTPNITARKSTPERRNRMLSVSEDCAFDHPLLHTKLLDIEEPADVAFHIVPTISPSPPSKRPSLQSTTSSSFRSNLTASLRALKSAAQTVSNLATPTTFRDEDFLTRAIFSFSPELTDDRRPAPTRDPPSPALRRYLNPSHPSPAPDTASAAAEMHSYHELPHPVSTAKRKNLASIQLQTYTRQPPLSTASGASSPPVFISASVGQVQPGTGEFFYGAEGREREVRENSSFLRTYAVENAMVKRGKIDDGTRRARIWLPARKVGKVVRVEVGRVPRRWVERGFDD